MKERNFGSFDNNSIFVYNGNYKFKEIWRDIMTTNNIEIYAKRVTVATDDHVSSVVTLSGIETADVLAQFNDEEILDTLDFSDVHQYVIKRLAEDDE